MDATLASYLVFLLVILSVITVLIRRYGNRLYIYSALAAAYSLAFLWASFQFGRDIFDAMNMACLGLFGGGTYLLILSAVRTRASFKITSAFFLGLALFLIIVGVDAFLIEPSWLEVTRYRIEDAKIPRKVKIAVISDLQTDSVGAFEESVLKRTMAEKPDMIVFPGDYIQAAPPQQRQQMEVLNQLLHKVGLNAPLGVYATQGDSEASDWTPVFQNLPVTTFESSGTVSNECFAITGLTLNDSYQLLYKAPDTELYHIWVGHRPGFSLDDPPGDLLISGHTHGGQVQIPFFGPVVTFSIVPRQWGGGGLIELPGGKKLVISRGIGMERGFAPRIRFFCRPQLVFLDLYPASAGKE